MTEELRKRLEKAAKEKQREVTPHKDWGDVRYGFNSGAEWMFKEVGGETVLKEMRQTILEQAKEWIIGHTGCDVECNENGEPLAKSYIEGRKLAIEIATCFEADMNKLWEGEK